MGVKVVRELLRRNPVLPPERIGDVVFAATAQVGDQGLTLGRDVALLAGLPETVPGFADRPHVRGRAHRGDGRSREIAFGAATLRSRAASSTWATTRWATTSTSTRASSRSGCSTIGGPRYGQTAENLHDRFPAITRSGPTRSRSPRQQTAAATRQNGSHARNGRADGRLSPTTAGSSPTRDEFLRPGHDAGGAGGLKPAVPRGRPRHRRQLGRAHRRRHRPRSSRPSTSAAELGLQPKLRLVGYAYRRCRAAPDGLRPRAGDASASSSRRADPRRVDLFELNEPFAVQVLTWCDDFGSPATTPGSTRTAARSPRPPACGHRRPADRAARVRAARARRPLRADGALHRPGHGRAILWENVQ